MFSTVFYVKRGKQINVAVSENVYERLCFHSEKLGHNPATVASVAIAEWVISRDKSYRTLDDAKEVMREVMSGFMASAMDLDEDQLAKAREELEKMM